MSGAESGYRGDMLIFPPPTYESFLVFISMSSTFSLITISLNCFTLERQSPQLLSTVMNLGRSWVFPWHSLQWTSEENLASWDLWLIGCFDWSAESEDEPRSAFALTYHSEVNTVCKMQWLQKMCMDWASLPLRHSFCYQTGWRSN